MGVIIAEASLEQLYLCTIWPLDLMKEFMVKLVSWRYPVIIIILSQHSLPSTEKPVKHVPVCVLNLSLLACMRVWIKFRVLL